VAVFCPGKSRKSQINISALLLGFYAFGRADVVDWSGDPLHGLSIRLQHGSGPVQVELIGQSRYRVELGANRWRNVNDSGWEAYSPPWSASLVSDEPLTFKLTGQSSSSNVTAIRADGVHLDYATPAPEGWVMGLLGGLCVGVAVVLASSPNVGWVFLLLPLAVPFYPHWTFLVEGLRLTKTEDWELARIVLACSFLPALNMIATWLTKERALPKARLLWGAAFVLSMVLSPHEVSMVFGALIMLSHLVPIYRAGIPESRWLWDAPLLLLPVVFGWGLGLFLLMIFRGFLFYRQVPFFMKHAPRPAVDQAFLMLALLPITLEWSLADTYLQRAWSSDTLEGQASTGDDSSDSLPHWENACGGGQGGSNILYVGGSSTRSSYQFDGEEEAFFPGQIHKSLCRARTIHTYNYAEADRDTHTISRSLEEMLDATDADLMVLYVGHNDLGGNNPYSRKEREARSKSTLRSIGRFARRSRVIVGADLLLRLVLDPRPAKAHIERPPVGRDGAPVDAEIMAEMMREEAGAGLSFTSSVPLEDARENLLKIADLAQARNTKCLLVAQYIGRARYGELAEYWRLEEALASSHPNIWFSDPREELRRLGDEEVLVDNNHLSRRGHQALAQALELKIRELLPQ